MHVCDGTDTDKFTPTPVAVLEVTGKLLNTLCNETRTR